METCFLENDVRILYVTANSFPAGVLAAHQKLHALIPYSAQRRYFGLSRPENAGTIVYRAAAEELKPSEAEELGLQTLILKKGKYISTIIKNYHEDVSAIEKAFSILLKTSHLDRQGYCVEWYLNDKDVQCMVRLTE
jgi:hypothetical protein